MISKDLFNYLKSYGFKFKMYDEDGNGPIIDFELAEYIYAVKDDSSLMIVVEHKSSRDYKNLYLYKTPNIKQNTFRKILADIKRIGANYGYSTTVKSFGREITPKDFALLPKQKKKEDMTESFEHKAKKKTSYLMKERAKVVVKHSESDSELKKNIKEMYVVSKNGEKRKLPRNNLSLGKAIANHVNAGGNLYDKSVNDLFQMSDDFHDLSKMDFDSVLTECTDDQKESLKEFMKEARKQINRYIGNLARKKSQLDECNYNTPEKTFSRGFFSHLTNDDDLADKLSNISMFITIIKK